MRGGAMFSVFLCVAVAATVGVGRHVAAAPPPDTPAAAAPASTPAPHVPEGFGKAKFGMTLEQVRQLYPTLAPAPAATSAAYFRSPNLTRYWMTQVDVPGLQGQCSIELRFWKNQLWSVIVYYGTNAFSDVVENLQRTYGPPTTKTHDSSWVLGTATITTSPGQMWFSLDDSEIGKDVQNALLEAVEQQKTRKASRTPGGAAQVVPTPGGRGTPAP